MQDNVLTKKFNKDIAELTVKDLGIEVGDKFKYMGDNVTVSDISEDGARISLTLGDTVSSMPVTNFVRGLTFSSTDLDSILSEESKKVINKVISEDIDENKEEIIEEDATDISDLEFDSEDAIKQDAEDRGIDAIYKKDPETGKYKYLTVADDATNESVNKLKFKTLKEAHEFRVKTNLDCVITESEGDFELDTLRDTSEILKDFRTLEMSKQEEIGNIINSFDEKYKSSDNKAGYLFSNLEELINKVKSIAGDSLGNELVGLYCIRDVSFD